MSNDPNPDDLFCPGCGANIDGHMLEEMTEVDCFYLPYNTTIYKMACGAYVMDGEFLSKVDMLYKFG